MFLKFLKEGNNALGYTTSLQNQKFKTTIIVVILSRFKDAKSDKSANLNFAQKKETLVTCVAFTLTNMLMPTPLKNKYNTMPLKKKSA